MVCGFAVQYQIVRAVFVFDHFGPYHLARVGAVAALPDMVVTGVELHSKSRTYGWNQAGRYKSLGFEKISLPPTNLSGRQERRLLRSALEQTLESCAPDVVFVNGWGDFMSLETISWAMRRGCKLVVMSETRRSDGARSILGEWLKRRVVKLCDAGLCGGESHRSYLEELGLPKDRAALGYNAVDNEFFGKIQNGIGISDCPYFLASNRFVERKNLGRLIEAYARYVNWFSGQRKRIWPLVLMGDGKLRADMEALARKLGLEILAGDIQLNSYKLKTACEGGLVVFPGFRQIDELLEFYAGAGAFVHPALLEPWGLVINEAMASGLPILSSNNVGAAEELLKEGINGFSFDPRNIEELASVLKRMADLTPEQRKSMGAASRKIVSEWGPKRFAQGAREAMEKAMKHPIQSAGILDRLLLEILIRK